MIPTGNRRPPGVHPEDRKLSRCPVREVKPSEWRIISVWSAWRRLGGMPGPGCVQDQEAQLVEAFAVLDLERDLIGAYHAQVAERRARNG